MIGIVSLVLACCALLAIAAALERVRAYRQAKLARLISKHNNPEIARRILHREVWHGQTKEQLLDSLGPPATSTILPEPAQREIWHYGPRGGGRYRFTVTLHDGRVTGMDTNR